MVHVPFWTIYSYWLFAMMVLWAAGRLPFSPLASAIFSCVGSFLLVFLSGSFDQAKTFIVVTHLVPLWILRNTRLDIVPNLKVFIIYNLFLALYGTNFVEVYTKIITHAPTTIRDYFLQRFTGA